MEKNKETNDKFYLETLLHIAVLQTIATHFEKLKSTIELIRSTSNRLYGPVSEFVISFNIHFLINIYLFFYIFRLLTQVWSKACVAWVRVQALMQNKRMQFDCCSWISFLSEMRISSSFGFEYCIFRCWKMCWLNGKCSRKSFTLIPF